MTRWRFVLGGGIAALVLSGCSVLHTIPARPADLATQPATSQDRADAANRNIWGIYTQLAGQSLTSSRNGGTTLSWRWVRPGQVLEEEWQIKGTDSPLHTFTMWRGEQPGVLYSQASGLMGMAWQGSVQADGSVAFDGAAPLSSSYLARLTPEGTLELRPAEFQHGQLVSTSEPHPFDVYRRPAGAQTAGQPTGNGRAKASALADARPPARETAQRSTQSASVSSPAAVAAATAPPRLPPDAQARQTAAKKAKEEAARAQATATEAQQALAQAQTEASKASAAWQTLKSLEASTKPVPKGRSKVGDFWTYCWYGVLSDGGKITHKYVTNLINQRMWDEPFPRGSEKGKAEFKAYDGPNTTFKVQKRWERAMKTSGLLPRHSAFAARCHTYVNYQVARSYYDDGHHDTDPKPVMVVWKNLEAPHIEGSLRVPTPEEAARIKRAADDAQLRLKTAQAAAKNAADVAARRQEFAARAQACVSGDAKACAPRAIRN